MARTKKTGEEQTAAPSKTGVMLQYDNIKTQYPDAILLFRMGDFYETFGTDAIETSSILGITLTRRV